MNQEEEDEDVFLVVDDIYLSLRFPLSYNLIRRPGQGEGCKTPTEEHLRKVEEDPCRKDLDI